MCCAAGRGPAGPARAHEVRACSHGLHFLRNLTGGDSRRAPQDLRFSGEPSDADGADLGLLAPDAGAPAWRPFAEAPPPTASVAPLAAKGVALTAGDKAKVRSLCAGVGNPGACQAATPDFSARLLSTVTTGFGSKRVRASRMPVLCADSSCSGVPQSHPGSHSRARHARLAHVAAPATPRPRAAARSRAAALTPVHTGGGAGQLRRARRAAAMAAALSDSHVQR